MSVPSRIAVAGAVVTTASAALLTAAGAASASPSCSAWGAMPQHVALGRHPVTIHLTLRGSGGCRAGGVDNGGTATLRGPGAKDPHRWAHFGGTDTQTFALRVDRLGTYTLQNADIQVYDSREQLVPVHWRRTSVVVTKK